MVYAIQDYEGGPAKIGYVAGGMDAVKRRLVGLQCGNPVDLHIVAAIEGGADEERAIHSVLNRCRIRGEWFDVPILLCDCRLAKLLEQAREKGLLS